MKEALRDRYLSGHYAELGVERFRDQRLAWFRHNYAGRLPGGREARILEIGPGYGEVLAFLRSQAGFTAVTAIDLSTEVAEACNRACPGSTLVVDDAEEFLRVRPAAYDCVLMFHVLEHVPKALVPRMLEAVFAALAPGGVLLVETPNMGNPLTGLDVRYADFTHEVGFTELSLRQVLTAAGFREVEVFGPRAPFDRPARAAQRLVQLAVGAALWVGYRAFGLHRPRIVAAALGAEARK